MNLTLHITDECNMRCAYCVHDYSAKRMSLTTAVAAVDLSICSKDDPLIPSGCKHTGLCFYGGEPLLNRDLIEKTVAYCDTLRAGKGEVFYYLLVTNGTLMDESFLEFAAAHDIGIGLSHDGLMQEDSRRMEDGTSSADRLEETIDLLLRYRPKATAMCTIHPPLVDRFAESVRWLFGKGFRKVQTVPAVGIKADWTPGRMEELEKQYLLLSDFYAEKTRAGDDFELTLFENKIRSHIMDGRGINQTCRFGKRQLSVAPDGAIYPLRGPRRQYADGGRGSALYQEALYDDPREGSDVFRVKSTERNGRAAGYALGPGFSQSRRTGGFFADRMKSRLIIPAKKYAD